MEPPYQRRLNPHGQDLHTTRGAYREGHPPPATHSGAITIQGDKDKVRNQDKTPILDQVTEVAMITMTPLHLYKALKSSMAMTRTKTKNRKSTTGVKIMTKIQISL